MPTPTLIPTLTPAVEVQEDGWQSFTSDRYGFSLSYPSHWQYMPDATTEKIDLDHIQLMVSPQNETFVSPDGCVIVFGFGGGHGPTRELINIETMIDGRPFTERTWFQDGTPIFRAYLAQNYDGMNFDIYHAWFAPNATDLCVREIDGITAQLTFNSQ